MTDGIPRISSEAHPHPDLKQPHPIASHRHLQSRRHLHRLGRSTRPDTCEPFQLVHQELLVLGAGGSALPTHGAGATKCFHPHTTPLLSTSHELGTPQSGSKSKTQSSSSCGSSIFNRIFHCKPSIGYPLALETRWFGTGDSTPRGCSVSRHPPAAAAPRRGRCAWWWGLRSMLKPCSNIFKIYHSVAMLVGSTMSNPNVSWKHPNFPCKNAIWLKELRFGG